MLPGPPFPVFESPKALEAACDRGLVRARGALSALEMRPADAAWLAGSDDLNAQIEDDGQALWFLQNVHPDKAIRDASEACELRWQDFLSTMGQSEPLYRAAKQVQPADAIDAEFRKSTLETLEDSGVGLAPEARARAKAISDRLTALNQDFARHLRDDKIRLPFAEVDLKGVPEAVWKTAPQDDQGRRLLGLDYPVSIPVIELAESALVRERMWRAFVSRGGTENLKLLKVIVELRHEYAGLFGFASYADFVMQRRMAGSAAAVDRFLASVRGALVDREARELKELKAAKAEHLQLPVGSVRIDRWDVRFYAERIRQQRYSVDQEAFRPYFPPRESLSFALRVIEKMMAVKYTPVAEAPRWHPDVFAFAVSDAASGKSLATLYVDLFPREGKYGHAAVFPLRSESARLGRASQAALVVNLNAKGLTLDELETLLHELGHSVHNNLSTARHSSQAGTAVKLDFVEAPSQMLEDWVYHPEVLMVFREVCPHCQPVPADLLQKADRARRYGKGVYYSRQWLQAAYDMKLYGAQVQDPLRLWIEMESQTPLGYVDGTTFPAGFAHVAGGYAAGYYSYLWSEVVAIDLRTAFGANRLDPAVGVRYRNSVLAEGGQRPAQDLVRGFLGREVDPKAFFDELAK
jgi:thimet oligopeptidase